MNEAMVKEQARERLLSAELAEVLEIDAVAIDEAPAAAPPRRWLAAALLLLGVAVAGGVAWLRAHDVHEVQQREFDPTDLWWEHELPVGMPVDAVSSPQAVALLSADRDQVTVWDRGPDFATLREVLQRDRIHVLHLIVETEDLAALPWAELLRHEELRCLALLGATALAPAQVRDLRLLPNLESLSFQKTLELDDPTVAALLGLTKLRHLGLVDVAVLPGAMRRLAGLADLRTMSLARLFGRDAPPDGFFAELAALRQVRGLLLDFGHPLTRENAQHLGTLPHLEDLTLWGTDCADEALAELPATLRSLHLFTLRGVSEQGLLQLGKRLRLRSFGTNVAPPSTSIPAVAALFAVSPIERYDSVVLPDDAMLAALASVPTLKRLTVHDRQGRLPELLGELARLAKLEVLHVYSAAPPRPEQLTVLRDHPTLRRVVVQLDQEPDQRPGEAELNDLRTAAGCEVEVR